MINANNKEDFANSVRQRRRQKKITPQRLKNIGLYYLERYETSRENLRQVLQRRVAAYARENPDWQSAEALEWIENILDEFERLHYLDDARFAALRANSYVAAGKPARYIQNKLRQKGVAETEISEVLAQLEYDETAMAMRLAERKKIGPYRLPEQRREYRQKDMGTLLRAGFSYDVVQEVLGADIVADDDV